MMSSSPIRWQSRIRRQAILKLLASRAQTALAQWVQPDRVASSLEHARPVAVVEDCWALDTGCGTIMVMGPAAAFDSFGCRLVGLSSVDGFGITEGLGRRAMTDILASMCNVSTNDCSISGNEATRPEHTEAKRGIASFCWQIADLDFALHLDAALCDHLLKPDRTRPMKFATRESAVMDCVVELKTIVNFGRIDAIRIADIKPGNVIKTEARLDEPVSLIFCADRPAMTGELVALNENRAFRCIQTIKEGALA